VRASGAPLWAYAPRQLSALYALCAWRAALSAEERAALAPHLPPRLLKNIAQRVPVSRAELNELQGVSYELLERYGEPVTRVVREAAAAAPRAWVSDAEDAAYEAWGLPLRPSPPPAPPLEGELRRAWLRYVCSVSALRLGASLEAFVHPSLFSGLQLFTLAGPDGDSLAELRPFLTGEEHALFLRALEAAAREVPLPAPPLETLTP